MKTLIKNLFIFFTLFCCQNIFAQSGGVCGYYYTCNNPPFVGPCYCTGDPSASGTITASQYGTMTFHLTATALTYNCCGNPYYGGASVSVSTSGGGSLGSASSSIGTNTDDVVVACVAPGDTFDWHASGEYGSYNISVSYSDVPAYNDVEPNGSIATATFLAENTTANGNIGHGYYANDAYDYYRIIAAVEGEITGTANFDGPGYLELVSKSDGTISSSVTSTGGVVTLSYDCVGKNDTLFWRIDDYGSTCSGYTLSYDLEPPAFGSSEAGPNGTIATAMPLAENDTVQGGIGHGYYANDAYDYYRIIADGGAIVVTASFDKAGYLYLYNKSGSYLSGITATTPETVSLLRTCLAANDTLYARISEYSSTCSSYDISYQHISYVYTNDIEPNGGTSTATTLSSGVAKQGQLYSSDTYDYYKIIAGASGFLAVECNFDVAGTIKLYNSSGSAIASSAGVLPEATTNGSGTAYIYKDCINNGETYYVRVSKLSSACTGYKIIYHINEENTFVSGNPIPEKCVSGFRQFKL